jgi:hypothetical protein
MVAATPNNWWIIYHIIRRYIPRHRNESILKMEVASSSEKLISIRYTTRHHMAEGHYVHMTVLPTALHFEPNKCYHLPAIYDWVFQVVSCLEVFRPKSQVHFLSVRSFWDPAYPFATRLHQVRLKLHDRLLSAVRDWLFNIYIYIYIYI